MSKTEPYSLEQAREFAISIKHLNEFQVAEKAIDLFHQGVLHGIEKLQNSLISTESETSDGN